MSSAASDLAASDSVSFGFPKRLHVLCVRRWVFFVQFSAVGSFCVHRLLLCQSLGGMCLSSSASVLFLAAFSACAAHGLLVLLLPAV